MFIVIEGIDGTGKSTLSRRLAVALGTQRTLLTREPTDESPWGRRLRRSETEGRLGKAEELDHFHKDRLHHLDTLIKPALAEGRIVLCDRYLDSTLAYQCAGPEEAQKLYEQMAPDLLLPDLVILLDCPVELALERIGAGRDHRTSFEHTETLSRAREIYLSRLGDRYERIDASRGADAVFEAALGAIAKHFPDLV